MPRSKKRTPARAAHAAPTSTGAAPRARLSPAWSAALIAGAIAAVYWNSLAVPFHFDDYPAIVENTSIRRLWSMSDVLWPERNSPVSGRPPLNLSFALNYAAGGLDVVGYHAGNIAIHAACALLLWGLLRRMLAASNVPDSIRAAASGVATASALLWALHPLHTTTVTYVSARSESLMAVFYLFTLYAAARACDSTSRRWSVLAVLGCAIGMLAKEAMVTAPVMVALADRAFFFPSVRAALSARWRLYAALAATWLVLAVILSAAPRPESVGFATGITPWTYLLNQAVMVAEYLRSAVWPQPIVFAYGEPRLLMLADVWRQALLVLAFVSLSIAAWFVRPALGFWGLWFFVLLAPTSTIVPIATEVGAGRRAYLPLVGVVVVLVSLVRLASVRGALASTGRPGAAWPAAPALVAIALAALTVRTNAAYASAETLWRETLEYWPSSLAHRNLGTALRLAGKREEAIRHFRATLGDHPEMRYTLGVELMEVGRLEESAEEFEAFLDVPVATPADRLDARYALARVLTDLRRPREAIDHLRLVLQERPGDNPARLALAEAYFQAGDFTPAAAAYRQYTNAEPRHAGAWTNFGIALLATGEIDEGVAALRRAAELEPRSASAMLNLARALQDSGHVAEASPYAAKAVALAPDDPAARLLYGQLLKAEGRAAAARAEFERLLQIDPGNSEARRELSGMR